MLQIFILAAVAIFLFWRLRAVLGSRDGFEKNLKDVKASSDVVIKSPDIIDETKKITLMMIFLIMLKRIVEVLRCLKR